MKRLYFAILIFFAVLAFNCQKDFSAPLGTDPGISNTTEPAPITSTLQGNVFDKNGAPAMGVTIKVGTKTATTDVRGYFRIKDAALDKSASVVTAEKAGYFKAYRTFSATSGVNQVTIKLIEKTVSGTINAGSGGNVTLTNGAKIALPANGVVKATGGSYTGTINVYASYIDPTATDISQVVPGSFIANDKDGKRVTLASYGMLAVELESSAGEKLQIASGSKATLTSPIPSSIQSSAPNTISLWYVDEQTGIWKEEGTATKTGTNYVGDVSHFTYWNCDMPYQTVGFTATIVTSEGVLAYAYLRIKVASPTGIGYAYGHTDSAGQISGAIPANQNLVLEVLDQCMTVIYTQNIGPFSSSVNLGTITIPAVNHLVTVKGKLLNCNGNPVTNGYAIFKYDYFTRMAATDNNGNFSLTFTTCNNSSTSFEIFAVDETTQQQGAAVNLPFTAPLTDVGNLTACGTSTTEYITYNLDGTNYSMSVPGDSVIVYLYNQAPNPPYANTIVVTGIESPGPSVVNSISFSFGCNTSPGIFPMGQFSNSTGIVTLSNSASVTLTNFPTVIGQYYEGSFTAQYTEPGNPAIHTVSGSFRGRKNW